MWRRLSNDRKNKRNKLKTKDMREETFMSYFIENYMLLTMENENKL